MNYYNQLETIRKIQEYHLHQMEDNLEKTSKLPFYNTFPYRPSKQRLAELKEGVKDIVITPLQTITNK